MKNKKKPKKNQNIVLLVVLLLLIGFVFDHKNGSVLGDRRDGDKGDKGENRDKGGNKDDGNKSDTYPSVTTIITPSVTYAVSPTIYPIVEVTVTQTLTPTLMVTPPPSNDTYVDQQEEVIREENTTTNAESDNKIETFRKEENEPEIIVSVTERSVLNQTQTLKPISASQKSVIKSIGQTIKNVGKGEFLSSPKPTVTPPLVRNNIENEKTVGLGPDSSIFYTLLNDSNVLLGAVDKENNRINVDEIELRGAELTMDKVLRKKGLSLGVSSGNSLVLVDGDEAKAYFDMPVYVDVFSHEVSFGTVDGNKKVSLLPSQVFSVLSSAKGVVFDESSKSMKIDYINDNLNYVVEARKIYLLFGRFPVFLKKNVFVNVENGDLSYEDDSLVETIVKSASK